MRNHKILPDVLVKFMAQESKSGSDYGIVNRNA